MDERSFAPTDSSTPPDGPPTLELVGLTRRFPQGGGVESIDLAVSPGERLAIVGPSGSGKSTLLRLIAGLEHPDSGAIRIDGVPATDWPPHRRGLAMVFQDQPPYPHLDVAGNLAFGLKARGRPRAEIRLRVAEVAELLGIDTLLSRSPAKLSGGERRRVVLGRALATQPNLLLLDEPFSALDPPLSRSIRSDLIDLNTRRQTGAILLVTHDQGEAMAFGQRLAVIRDGRLIQIGPPHEVYSRPDHRFVAEFLGDPGTNLLRCQVRVDANALRLEGLVPGASWAMPRGIPWVEVLAARANAAVDLALRPEQIHVIGSDNPADASASPTVIGRVDRVESQGGSALVSARLGSHRIRFLMSGSTVPEPGDRLPLCLPLSRASWFDPTSGRALFASPID
ncbi:ABC transporter ATP-binding protein [Tautonia rosea]|uniref:ABC transporter ATP-binding protein n=1 Tax=Tautonia rosea TaxID=2728037 RepID=UPI0014755D15|nr:ABC transporter ATP-binding protein [Tautonia rosea]